MIGVSCTGFSSSSLEEWAPRISEHFRLWEIFSEADHDVTLDSKAIAGILRSNGLICQVHAPICDWNIGAMNDRLREASIREIEACVSAASEIEAGMVTVHPGLGSLAVPGLEGRAHERAKAAMRRIEKASKENSILVAIENMPSMPFFLGRTAKELNDLVDGTDLGITFDIGHANTMGQIDAMIDTFADRIINIHIHDNHGSKDEHLTIGDGDIDFKHVFDRMGSYKGNWIIESKSLESAVQSLLFLKRYIS